MDLADLKVFEAVARLGGMNRAAVELNTVQSNVTARIRLLEQDLATPTAALRLASPLAAYAAKYPSVDVTLRTGTTCELVKEVLGFRLEGAFVCGPVNHPELAEIPAFREELAVLAPAGLRDLHEVFRQRQMKIVVLRAGCSYRQRLEEVLARRGIVDVRLLEFGTIEAILGCVAAGLGITRLPKNLTAVAVAGASVAVHTLPEAEGVVETVFIHRRDAFISSALSAFLALTCAGPMRHAAE